MRIFVIHLHVAVRRRAIEIEEGLFHVLAVISRAQYTREGEEHQH
jgi:hypothetical protein